MSMAPQALERSVLERKERDELAAIAEAMGVKPAARASKATLIDQILREAGIETGEERPKRTRAPRSQSPARENGAAQTAAATAAAAGAPEGEVSALPGLEPSPGDAPTSSEPASPPAEDNAPADAPAAGASGDGADPATAAAADGADGAAGAPAVAEAAPQNGSSEAAATDAPSPENAAASNGSEGGRTATAASATGRTSTPATGQPTGSSRGDDRGRGDQRGAREAAPSQQSDNREGREQRDSRNPRDGNRGNQGGGQATDTSGEPGNRRSRRRRGRDRGEREPQQDRSQDPSQYQGELVATEGLLDLRDEGYGFLRNGGYLASPRDAYVSLSQVRRFALRKGDYIKGAARPAGTNEKYPALLRIDTVNDMTPDEARSRSRFEDLTPLFPDSKLRLEVPGDSNNMIARIVDLISPIGKGQRGLIVSPPKAGKTTVLKQIAHSIEANNPEVKLIVLLVDERPEEVTDFRRSVKGDVVSSTFDRPSEEHTQVAELALERSKRLVELGHDVVIVLDGITRLARAYNLAAPATGRIMSGGIDTGALYPPKRFFGAARNIEEGGSITILATALVETGSKMDEVIFEEFKGTGNMELKLDRKLAERRIYPALDVNASSTRHEELLFERGQLPQVWKLRRVLNALEAGAGLELLMDKIKSTKSNDEFLADIAKAPVPAI
ncbi:MAG: transcription termination factor Rho [Actinobacteria bacterium]|nr:transcription termination factor Rho [Actinomycetota bacterium]